MSDLPVAALPLPHALIHNTASRHAVDETELGSHLADIYAALLDDADTITQYYDTTTSPPTLQTPDALGELLFITPPVWPQLPTTVPHALRPAIQTTYTTYARTLGAAESHLARYDLVLLPTPSVAALNRAGLSPRQSMVQTLRTHGHTQEEIGDALDIATNTVKVHCHRIDRKVSAATQLLDLVDP